MEKEKVFFGAKKIAYDMKTSLVNSLFTNVAGKYDLMNDLMSIGIHRIWKNRFCSLMDNPNAKILDMAGGTCDITKRFYRYCEENGKNPDITVCDLNLEMLKLGEEKLINNRIFSVKFVNAAAETLPFESNYFDVYSVAFGIRNFTDIETSLKEAKRVLKKGGKFMCLEFSKPQNPVLDKIYNIYSQFVIPSLGKAIVDKESYQYLVESIEKFPPQNEFAKMIEDSGFSDVGYQNLTDGIVAIHTAYKK